MVNWFRKVGAENYSRNFPPKGISSPKGIDLEEEANNHQPNYTLPETNIAPENRAPQKETSIPTIHF